MDLLANQLNESKICLSYFGSFSDEITDKLIGISESYLENRTELGKIKNKVSFLIAECFQNIVRHGDIIRRTNPISHSDFFQLNVLKDRVVLTSCNLIDNAYIAGLEKKLEQVNSLNAEQLKKLYNEVLQNEGFSSKGGAGLGLIEMARKSGLPIKYLFKELDNKLSRFFLSLEIIHKNENQQLVVAIGEIEKFYNDMSSKKALINYKGDFSRDTIVPMIEMLQYNFKTDETLTGKEKRSLISLIESLQNVSKHGKTVNGNNEGIFTILKEKEEYILEISNAIDEHNHAVLNETLSAIQKMTMDEISKLYKQRLIKADITREGNCGLGLLEMAKNSNNNFNYKFSNPAADELFYTLKITI